MIVKIQFYTNITHPILIMLQLTINRNSPESIFIQLVNQIIELIEKDVITKGYRLPATRQLARKTGVNRSTIVRVYEELWARGYVDSRMGSYTRVRKRKKIVLPNNESRGSNEEEGFAMNYLAGSDHINVRNFTRLITADTQGVVNLQRLEPDPGLVNRKLFGSCFRQAINDNKFDLFGYCHPRGYEPLRNTIIKQMQLHSINSSDENILITNGSQNSLQLLFQAFLRKDENIVIESPTYSMIIPLIHQYGARVFEIPVRKDGLDINALRNIMEKHQIRLIYTMPTLHNPTGITMSQKKREELLQLCERHGTIIIEDSFEEELKYFGKTHLPIKSMDSRGVVIYLGTFSKVLSPGLRTGWIIGNPNFISRLTDLKTAFDLTSNTLSQVLLYRFCIAHGYELHIRKLSRVFRKRMNIALKALRLYLPHGKAQWYEPLGGFLIWLRIITKRKDINFEEYFGSYGVRVSNGNSFFYSPAENDHIRISISKSSETEIEEGIRRIGQGLQQLD